MKNPLIVILILVIFAVAIFSFTRGVDAYIPPQNPAEIAAISVGDTVLSGQNVVSSSKVRKVPLIYHPEYLIEDLESKEYNVVRSDAVLVHANPGPDEEHGSAGGAQHVGEEGAQEQEQGVDPRRGLPLDIDVNAAGHDIQRANQRNETHILVCAIQHAVPLTQAEKIITKCNRAERQGDFRIMLAPPARGEQGGQRDGPKQQPKR